MASLQPRGLDLTVTPPKRNLKGWLPSGKEALERFRALACEASLLRTTLLDLEAKVREIALSVDYRTQHQAHFMCMWPQLWSHC